MNAVGGEDGSHTIALGVICGTIICEKTQRWKISLVEYVQKVLVGVSFFLGEKT